MPLLSGAAKVQGCTREGECWRWYARGVARHCRPQGAVASNVIVARTPQPCSAARPGQGGAGPWGGCKCDHSQTAGGIIGTADQAIYQPWPANPREKPCRNHEQPACRTASRPLAAGRAKTTSVIDAITRRARPEAGLPVLILTIPNNPILQSCALPDYNCGATLARTEMCVHICHLTDLLVRFPSFLHRFRIIAGPTETPLCKISF
jgi:hypothetical protein